MIDMEEMQKAMSEGAGLAETAGGTWIGGMGRGKDRRAQIGCAKQLPSDKVIGRRRYPIYA